MIYDILEVFKKEYQKSGDRLILGKYELKDGLYVRINREGKLEYFEAKTLKKDKVFSTIDGRQDSQAHTWFIARDYLSSGEVRKALDAPKKVIHNINYLTLFMKADEIKKINFQHIRDKLFLTLVSFKRFKDKNDKEILEIYKNNINKFSRQKDVVRKYRLLERCFSEIVQKTQELEIKNYVKIFFVDELIFNAEASKIFLGLKIFNKNTYNKKDISTGILYGLSNANMGLNNKKPFLENKTRKIKEPFLILNEDALILKKFFDWLKLQPYSQDRYLDEHFFMQKQSKNDEAEIKEFDYIPLKKDDVQRYFKTIEVKNCLKIRDKDKQLIQDYKIKELYQLEEKVDELFYNKQLIFNYYNDDIKVSGFISKELQKLLFITKYSMNNYFRKFQDESFENTIKKFGTAFVLDSFRNGRIFKARNALNLKFAILGVDMDIEKTVSILEKRLEEEGNYENMQRNEFMFLAGQWAYYLLKQSNSIDKTFALAEHYFKARNMQRLKKALSTDFEKYKHAIHRESKRNRKVIALIKSFESDEERLSDKDKDMFLVGFTVDSLMYNKKEKK